LGPKNPSGAANKNQVTINDPSTFNNYANFLFPVYFGDDIRIAADLILKYCSEGMGSTIARVTLDAPSTAGSIGTATIINAAGSMANTNASGQGGAKIKVKLPPCVAGGNNCLPSGTCGYAVYFSDTTVGGPLLDCASRVNSAAYWEMISLFPSTADQTTITVPVKICCSAGAIVVCTQTITICAKSTMGSVSGPNGGSCPC